MSASSTPGRRTLALGVAAVICLIAVVRITSTYRIFNNTFDEPAHIAAGIEWLDEGTYTHDTLHPPLPPVAVALGPYLDGVRSTRSRNPVFEETQVLYRGGRYWQRLIFARMGTLPFFLLAAWVVWGWSREVFGLAAALASLGLFTTLPPILAHAGLANTDMALTGTLGAALLMFVRWLREPSGKRGLLLGIFLGLALLSKISTLLFFPVAAAVIWTGKRWFEHGITTPGAPRIRSGSVLLIGVTAFLILWTGYRFSTDSMVSADDRPHETVDRVFGTEGTVHDALYTVLETWPVPAPQFFHGIGAAREKNENGHAMFVLGKSLKNRGVWYFFPVAFGTKTPIGFLLLTGFGLVLLVQRSLRRRGWFEIAPALCAATILLVVLPSNINIGLRHILPVYVFLSPVVGLGAVGLIRLGKIGSLIVAACVVWHLGSSIAAHPDYLAYFNETAGDHPEAILVDSDLDWGQDLHRLATELNRAGILDPGIAYFGTASIPESGILSYHRLPPDQYESGWVAISQTLLKTHIGYAWLSAYKPERIVGRSIALYHLPEK